MGKKLAKRGEKGVENHENALFTKWGHRNLGMLSRTNSDRLKSLFLPHFWGVYGLLVIKIVKNLSNNQAKNVKSHIFH